MGRYTRIWTSWWFDNRLWCANPCFPHVGSCLWSLRNHTSVCDDKIGLDNHNSRLVELMLVMPMEWNCTWLRWCDMLQRCPHLCKSRFDLFLIKGVRCKMLSTLTNDLEFMVHMWCAWCFPHVGKSYWWLFLFFLSWRTMWGATSFPHILKAKWSLHGYWLSGVFTHTCNTKCSKPLMVE